MYVYIHVYIYIYIYIYICILITIQLIITIIIIIIITIIIILGATRGVSEPTVYHFPKLPLYTNIPSCLGQWSATCL